LILTRAVDGKAVNHKTRTIQAAGKAATINTYRRKTVPTPDITKVSAITCKHAGCGSRSIDIAGQDIVARQIGGHALQLIEVGNIAAIEESPQHRTGAAFGDEPGIHKIEVAICTLAVGIYRATPVAIDLGSVKGAACLARSQSRNVRGKTIPIAPGNVTRGKVESQYTAKIS